MDLPLDTERKRRLLNLVNQLTQNLPSTTNGSLLSENVSLNLPGLGLDFDLDLGGGGGGSGSGSTPPNTPTTLRELLLSLVNEQVEVTTPFGVVTGTLIAVRDDYIVLIENTGDQVLVQIDNIELVSET